MLTLFFDGVATVAVFLFIRRATFWKRLKESLADRAIDKFPNHWMLLGRVPSKYTNLMEMFSCVWHGDKVFLKEHDPNFITPRAVAARLGCIWIKFIADIAEELLVLFSSKAEHTWRNISRCIRLGETMENRL